MAKSKAELSTSQKRSFAEILYMQGDLSQKEIAIRVGISENSLSNWVRDNHWNAKRKTLLSSKRKILATLYSVLEKQSDELNVDENIGDAKRADALSKTAAAINSLETETSIANITEVARLFTNYMLDVDKGLAVQFMEHLDLFVKHRLKNY